MSRWKITVREEHGRATLTLLDRSVAVGMATITNADYRDLCRSISGGIMNIMKTSMVDTMQTRLWQDAQRVCDENVDAAQRWLLGYGWNTDKIKSFVTELAVKVGHQLLNALPEHVS